MYTCTDTHTILVLVKLIWEHSSHSYLFVGVQWKCNARQLRVENKSGLRTFWISLYLKISETLSWKKQFIGEPDATKYPFTFFSKYLARYFMLGVVFIHTQSSVSHMSRFWIMSHFVQVRSKWPHSNPLSLDWKDPLTLHQTPFSLTDGWIGTGIHPRTQMGDVLFEGLGWGLVERAVHVGWNWTGFSLILNSLLPVNHFDKWELHHQLYDMRRYGKNPPGCRKYSICSFWSASILKIRIT